MFVVNSRNDPSSFLQAAQDVVNAPFVLGKCSKDKYRIASLLRDHTPEQIKRSITKYVEEQGGEYLKNFSTFLNNIPEYEDDMVLPLPVGERVTGQDWI